MAQRNVILDELEALNSLKELAESYEEIAAIRMQKIRNSVLKTRDFLSDISDVFVDLKSSYKREVEDLLSHRIIGDNTLQPYLRKKGKILLVYLSSNGKLYGAVTQKTYLLFKEDINKDFSKDADLLVIGQTGRELMSETNQSRKFEYFEIPDSNVGIDHIRELINKFIQYEIVYVYYGKFDNVVNQSPISTSITGEEIFETEIKSVTPRDDRFIFEPSLEKIFNFFETQITANLFSQTLLENQLARHASRVNAMEKALIHIDEEGKKLTKETIRIKHRIQNTKQLETISGLVLWNN